MKKDYFMDEEKEIFDRYHYIYEKIFKKIYPAKNSTGFAERNLSVNFDKAYESISGEQNQEVVCWYEFQFGQKNNYHIDAVIANYSLKELLLIESKRYSQPQKKIGEVQEDVERIYELIRELEMENKNGVYRIDLSLFDRIYGVILADVWTETTSKEQILNSYKQKIFVESYIPSVAERIKSPTYDVQSFAEMKNYHLISFCWEISKAQLDESENLKF